MKHESISVDNVHAFKESVLDVIQWTESTLKDRFRQVLNETEVTEDAGVIVPQYIIAYRKPGAVVAWTEVKVTATADSTYRPRIEAALALLKKEFHVEHSEYIGDRDELTVHRLSIRHEYDRPI